MKYDILSIGMNQKLGKMIAIVNQPAGTTCGGKTIACDPAQGGYCYAFNQERMYPSARNKRKKVHELSQRPDFVDLISKEIDHWIARCKKKGIKPLFRWHESGDVYSDEYLQKILQVVTKYSDVGFLMYTKTLKVLKWPATLPDNFKVYQSLDHTTIGMDDPNVRSTYVVPTGAQVPINLGYAETCSHNGPKDKHYCGTTCMKCWVGVPKIYFDEH